MELLYKVNEWIEENKKDFKPPVCNKLMHAKQLKVMFVGGPNIRKDYHIEEGEELFYQLQGNMCLKIIEKGIHKDVHILEGEMFLLPARVPHSPQRNADTVGLVIERERLKKETDCLRYYVEGSTDVLYEKWFYCEDLGTQLGPLINEFFRSEQYKTGKPNPDELVKETPFRLNTTSTVMKPFSFQDWIHRHRQELKDTKIVGVFDDHCETKTAVYGSGESEEKASVDTWIWQLEGTSEVSMNGKTICLGTESSLLIPLKTKYFWKRAEGCVALYIVQDPERKRDYDN